MAFIVTTKGISESNFVKQVDDSTEVLITDTEDGVAESYTFGKCKEMYKTLSEYAVVLGVTSSVLGVTMKANGNLSNFVNLVSIDSVLGGRWRCGIESKKVCFVKTGAGQALRCCLENGRFLFIYDKSDTVLASIEFEANTGGFGSVGFTWIQKLGSLYIAHIQLNVLRSVRTKKGGFRVILKTVFENEKCTGIYGVSGGIHQSSLFSRENIPVNIRSRLALAGWDYLME